jgi:hypothetical protein
VITEINAVDEPKIAAPPPVRHSSCLLGKEPQRYEFMTSHVVKLRALKDSLRRCTGALQHSAAKHNVLAASKKPLSGKAIKALTSSM